MARGILSLTLAAIAACVAAPADAATQLGATSLTPGTLTPGVTEVQTATAPASPVYVVPAGGGVITSWKTTGQDGEKKRLAAFAMKDATTFHVVGTSAKETVSDASLTEHSFPTRLAVSGGDLIGLIVTTDSPVNGSMYFSGSPQDVLAAGAADPSPGDDATLSGGSSSALANVAATLELDNDHDGFGDETQDDCSTDPGTQGQCSADLSVSESVAPPSLTVGGDVTFAVRVHNGSPTGVSASVHLADALPPGVPVVSAAASQGSCAGTGTLTCSLGSLGPGAEASLTVVVRPTATGSVTNTAVAVSATDDPDGSNNSATATATATAIATPAPAFPGAKIRTQTIVVKKGVARVVLSCSLACSGRLTLKTAVPVRPRAAAHRKARKLTLGSARVSLGAGATKAVRVKLSKAGRGLLASTRKVKAVALAVTTAAGGAPKSTRATVTLKLPRKRR